ncbi:hypothetical protein bAD24_I16785 [Burkholderia sp. AD24]|jgi:hypothetical protein|nr:hypothetical protein bAD24_I16785 [Burkholderia sp. AD24]
MALKKEIVIDSIGVPAQYHVVDNVNVSRSSNITSAVVLSYYTEAMYKAGKNPLGMATSIMLTGIPEAGSDPFRYAEQLLAQAQPADGKEDTTLYPGVQNRYLYAGAQIVPDAAHDAPA